MMDNMIPASEAIAKMARCAKALEAIAKAMKMQRGCTPEDVVAEAENRLRPDG